MRLLSKKLLSVVVVAALMLCMFPVGFAQAKSDDALSDYAEELSKKGKGLIALRLDDKAMEDYQLYYCKGGSYSYVALSETDFIKCEESKEFPGYYIVDLSEMDTERGYVPYGTFLIYEKAKTMVEDKLVTFRNDDVCFLESNCRTLDFYTISFEQGDIEVTELPNSYIFKKGYFDTWSYYYMMPEGKPGYIENGFNNNYMETGGYAFAWFADKNGKKADSSMEITAPVTLHPVFVNEQLITRNSSEYFGSNMYSQWTFDDETSDNEAKKINVKNGTELLNALMDKKSNFLLINGNVKLDKDTAKPVLDSLGKYYSNYDNTFRFGIHQRDGSDFIIIEKGGNLTIDGVQLSCGVNSDLDSYEDVFITVQDGGKLTLKNYAGIEYGRLSVQTKGEVNADDTSSMSLNMLYNYGTITFDAPKKLDPNRYSYMKALDLENTFFNAASGTINIKYREMQVDYMHAWSVGGSYSGDKNRVGDLHEIKLRNHGTIYITGNSKLTIGDGSGSVYQYDRVAHMPLVNYGIITVDADATDSTGGYSLGGYNIKLSYASFLNKGTLNITSNYGKNPVSESGDFYVYNGGMNVYESELVNEGIINLTSNAGVGLTVSGIFYDPSGSGGLSHTSVTEIQKGRINNKKGAVINVKTAKNASGIALGSDVELNNEGTVNLEYLNSKETACSYPLVLISQYDETRSPVVNNNGSIINNAYIGYTKDKMIWNGNKAKGSGKSGAVKGAVEQKDISKADVKISAQTYTGKKTEPVPIVELEGNTLSIGEDFTLTYKNNVNVGTATVTITGTGNYSGSIKKNFKINPLSASLSKLTGSKGSFKVTWKKQTKTMKKSRITGYEIQYSTDKKFKTGVKNVVVKGYNKAEQTVKDLKKGTYYVRIRTYLKSGKTTFYSDWSKSKKVTVKGA